MLYSGKIIGVPLLQIGDPLIFLGLIFAGSHYHAPKKCAHTVWWVISGVPPELIFVALNFVAATKSTSM